MRTLSELAKALNRSTVFVASLQTRFGLPVLEGAGYGEAYLAFLRTVVTLRILSISEESLRDLWAVEKKLLQLLHVDTVASPTWFLDACGETTRRRHRLLLSNFDLGPPVQAGNLQPGLDFNVARRELFKGSEMGEDALRVLQEYRKQEADIRGKVRGEVQSVQQALRWATDWERATGKPTAAPRRVKAGVPEVKLG